MKGFKKITRLMVFCVLTFFSCESGAYASETPPDAYIAQPREGDTEDQEHTDIYTTVENKELRTGSYMEGVLIELYDMQGNLKASWLSSAEPYVLSGFEKGNYLIKKSHVPEGVIPSADKQIYISGSREEEKIVLLDEVKVLNVSVTGKNGNPGSGGIVSLYKIPDGFLSYKERIFSGARCYIKNAGEEGDVSFDQKEAGNLLQYMVSAGADRTELRDDFDTELTFEYVLPKEAADTGRTFVQELPAGVRPAGGTQTKISAEYGGEKALDCRFREKNGTFYLEAEFDRDFVKEDLKGACSFGITFDAVVDKSLVRAGGCLNIWFKEDVLLTVGAHDIKNVDSEPLDQSYLKPVAKNGEKTKSAGLKEGRAVIRGIEVGRYAVILTESPEGYAASDEVILLFVAGDTQTADLEFVVSRERKNETVKETVKNSTADKNGAMQSTVSDEEWESAGEDKDRADTGEENKSQVILDGEEEMPVSPADTEDDVAETDTEELPAEGGGDGSSQNTDGAVDTKGSKEESGNGQGTGDGVVTAGTKEPAGSKAVFGIIALAVSVISGIGALMLGRANKKEQDEEP